MKFRTARNRRLRNYRRILAVALAVSVPVGLWTKVYRGIGQTWIEGSAGGVIYEMFWIFLVAFIFPELEAWAIAMAVFVVTSLLEFLQLWNPTFLAAARETFLGKMLLGSTFSWWDFPHYLLGCVLGGSFVFLLQAKILTPKTFDRF
ncbi:MAG: DUF2809 domain-containing protein [Cyanobacteria bacterium SID2]|nr:DUF2809 domain-containing protein [Cyanobacteria bacterium SID2]MBP0003887.1 DUF2809 domain-containing protein [Cyanobacteria bacterium SBC]